MRAPRGLWVGTLTLILMLGAVAGGTAWWYQARRPDSRLRQGQDALRRGRPDIADRLARRLEADGYPDHAHLLRGEAFLREHQLDLAVHEFNQIKDQGDLRTEAS